MPISFLLNTAPKHHFDCSINIIALSPTLINQPSKVTLSSASHGQAINNPISVIEIHTIINIEDPKTYQDSLSVLYQEALTIASLHHFKSIQTKIDLSPDQGLLKDLVIKTLIESSLNHHSPIDLDIYLFYDNETNITHLSPKQTKDLTAYLDQYVPNQDAKLIRDEFFIAEFLISSNPEPQIVRTDKKLHRLKKSFSDAMNEWMIKKNLTSDQVWKKANIDRKLFSKIFNNNHPSKKTAILITLALELTINASLDLLARAGYTLSMSLKEDLVIRWHIENNLHSVYEVCQTQLKLGLQPLF